MSLSKDWKLCFRVRFPLCLKLVLTCEMTDSSSRKGKRRDTPLDLSVLAIRKFQTVSPRCAFSLVLLTKTFKTKHGKVILFHHNGKGPFFEMNEKVWK